MKKNTLERFLLLSENKPVSAKTLKSLFRAITESVLENNEKGVVLLRVKNREGINGVITRLNYDEKLEVIDYCARTNQKNDIWVSTEFVLILTSRYSAFLLWDFENGTTTPFYTLINSKLILEPLEAISQNSTVDLSYILEEYKPDRRENLPLNLAFTKLCEALENVEEENAIKTLEKKNLENKALEAIQAKYNDGRVRESIHEIKNQLGILDIYSTIIEKKSELKEEAKTIKKAVSLINSELLSLRGNQNINLEEKDLNSLILEAVKLTKALGKVDFEAKENFKIYADEDKFISVLVNLIKNAFEAGGEVKITTKRNANSMVVLRVENNGEAIAIEDTAKIFDEGFSTKNRGSGIGLHLCKKTLGAMLCKIQLVKSDEESTVFEIFIPTL